MARTLTYALLGTAAIMLVIAQPLAAQETLSVTPPSPPPRHFGFWGSVAHPIQFFKYKFGGEKHKAATPPPAPKVQAAQTSQGSSTTGLADSQTSGSSAQPAALAAAQKASTASSANGTVAKLL
ncbi:hypothetical protein WJX73_002539 [Symbiochloris irregularis]|uniref:Uncharacterized protein n=1 Tax=Symbiochloris irregularis TaxID=706552 RepID=A0AAW1PI76_9CHLO